MVYGIYASKVAQYTENSSYIFTDFRDADIDLGDLIPRWKIDNSTYRKVKNGLKGTHGFCGCRTIDTIDCDSRNRRVILRNTV